MDCLLFGVIILSCSAMLIVLTRRYFSSRRTKLSKLPETWWTPGTENSANNDIRPYKVTFSEEVFVGLTKLFYRSKNNFVTVTIVIFFIMNRYD